MVQGLWLALHMAANRLPGLGVWYDWSVLAVDVFTGSIQYFMVST